MSLRSNSAFAKTIAHLHRNLLILQTLNIHPSAEVDPLLIKRPQQSQKIALIAHPGPLIRKPRLLLQNPPHFLPNHFRDFPLLLPRSSGLGVQGFGFVVELVLEESGRVHVVYVHDAFPFCFFFIAVVVWWWRFGFHRLRFGIEVHGCICIADVWWPVFDGDVVLRAPGPVVGFEHVHDGGCAEESGPQRPILPYETDS